MTDDPKMMKAAREACLAKTNSNNEEMRRYERALLGRGFDDGWKARASAEDRPLTEEQEKKVRRAMELIGARNDHLSEAAREGNINAAWHMLAALSRIRKEGE
jgi:hypothetical protein